MSLKALEVVERVSMTDEALCEEASRHVETLSFSMGARELSSSTSSRFGLVVLKGGSFGGLASTDDGDEQSLLSIILADGSTKEMASKGEKTMAREGVGREVEELL